MDNKPIRLQAPSDLWDRERARVREMRRAPTQAEGPLWAKLRASQLDGFKFRRQHAIGPYIVDFYCVQARLVIEVDGPIHDKQVDDDHVRQEYLEQLGLRVLRFTNAEVLEAIDQVWTSIEAYLTVN